VSPEASFKWIAHTVSANEGNFIRTGRYLMDRNTKQPPTFFCVIENLFGKSVKGEGATLAAAVHDCAVKFKEKGFK
jgi:hypothetical protein